MGASDWESWAAPTAPITWADSARVAAAPGADGAAKLVCHLAYASAPFRADVVARLALWPESPIRPTPGIDDEAVLRAVAHADVLHRQLRRALLPAVLAGGVLSVLAGAAAVLTYGLAIASWFVLGWSVTRSWTGRGSVLSWPAPLRATVRLLLIVVLAGVTAQAPPTSVVGIGLAALVVVVTLASVAATRASQRGVRLAAMEQGAPEPGRHAHPTLLQAVEWAQAAVPGRNVQLFSDYSPFEPDVDRPRSWHLTVDLGRAHTSNRPVERLDVAQLLDVLSRRLRVVGLRDLTVTEAVYAHVSVGHDLPLAKGPGGRILPQVSTPVLNSLERGAVRTARPYLRLTVPSAEGIPSLSAFVRVAIDGQTLYLETLHSPGLWIRRDLIEREMIDAGRRASAAPVTLSAVSDALSSIGSRLGTHGAPRLSLPSSQVWSILDLVPQSGPRTYFDEADVAAHIEMIDRQILSSIGAVLETANVDTSEFLSRTTQIINNSTVISNNSLYESALSVGDGGSHVSVSKPVS